MIFKRAWQPARAARRDLLYEHFFVDFLPRELVAGPTGPDPFFLCLLFCLDAKGSGLQKDGGRPGPPMRVFLFGNSFSFCAGKLVPDLLVRTRPVFVYFLP